MKIDSAKLKSGEILNFGDFNVFIGGNGVGKTTMLVELFHKISDLPRGKYFWIDQVKHISANLSADMTLLKSSLSRKYDGATAFYYSNATKKVDGNVDNSDALRFSSGEFGQINSLTDEAILNEARYRRPFVSFSSCDSRLTLGNEVNLNSLDTPPQDPLNVLYRNKQLLQDIDRNIYEIFKYHLVLLWHFATKLNIGISKEQAPIFDNNASDLQDEFEGVESWKTEKFIPITEAGHGIRSMIKLLTSLLEPVNQIILVDEPEMHLYPSQKRWLGKQLVSLARLQNKQVFLVTHDPMVLQGILDANTTTRIFRVDRDDLDVGIIKSCELDRIADASALRNQEQYLQGLFYQRCVIVEGASDRSFYQNMFDRYAEIQDKDLGVVVAGGKGNSKHIAHIVSKVGLKAVFIYDLDVLLEETMLIKDVYSMLGGSNQKVSELEDLFSFNPVVTDKGERWKKIKEITGYTSKAGISEEWKNLKQNREILEGAISALSEKGIFFVPSGTLESWAPDVEPKVRFAEMAPEVVMGDDVLKRNFDEFSKRVLNFLDVSLAV